MQIPEIPVDMRVKVQSNLGIPYFRHGPRLHAIAIWFPVPTELAQASFENVREFWFGETPYQEPHFTEFQERYGLVW